MDASPALKKTNLILNAHSFCFPALLSFGCLCIRRECDLFLVITIEKEKRFVKVKGEGWGLWNVKNRYSSQITFLLLDYHGNCWGKQSLSLKRELRLTTVWKLSFEESNAASLECQHKCWFLLVVRQTIKGFCVPLCLHDNDIEEGDAHAQGRHPNGQDCLPNLLCAVPERFSIRVYQMFFQDW